MGVHGHARMVPNGVGPGSNDQACMLACVGLTGGDASRSGRSRVCQVRALGAGCTGVLMCHAAMCMHMHSFHVTGHMHMHSCHAAMHECMCSCHTNTYVPHGCVHMCMCAKGWRCGSMVINGHA